MAGAGGRSAPLKKFYEIVPYISMGTALAYIIVILIGAYFIPYLLTFEDTVTEVMLVGAVLFAPLIAFDVIFTSSFELKETASIGITNFFAMLIAFWRTNTAIVQTAVQWAIIAYVALFVVGLIAYVARK